LRAVLQISGLAKKTGVRSATLRYWERLGLLPRAARTHTGYRSFGVDAIQYVEFIRRSKDMGLSLRQMRRVLDLARTGQSPCKEVEQWAERKLETLESQIQFLRKLQRRLRCIRKSSTNGHRSGDRSKELCCLIEGLPEAKKFQGIGDVSNAKTICSSVRSDCDSHD